MNASARLRKSLVAAVLLFGAASTLFWPATGFGFIAFDDPAYVTDNPRVLLGLDGRGIAWAFGAVGVAGNWHPLAWISHMTDVSLFGLAPAAHHRTNILIHAAACAVLLIALERLLRLAPSGSDHALVVAGWTAAVVAFHPQRVESVAWISERKDVLAFLFLSFTLLGYAGFVRRPSRGRQAWFTVPAALGLLAKPTLVTVPALLLVADFWPLRRCGVGTDVGPGLRTTLAIVREKVPLVILAAITASLTWAAQRAGGAVSTLGDVPWTARLQNAVVSLAAQLGSLFVPIGLSPFHPFPVTGIPTTAVLLSIALVGGASMLAWRLRRSMPWWLAGWCWFVIALVPMLGIVQVGMQSRADRYTYVSHVGLVLALVYATVHALANVRGGRVWIAIGMAGTLVASAAATRAYLPAWRDTESWARRALAATDANFVAHHVLGQDLAARGDRDGAIREFERALAVHPGYLDAARDLAGVLVEAGRPGEALAILDRLVRDDPRDASAHVHRGMALLALSRSEEAERDFRVAVDLDPASWVAWTQLGVALEWRRATAAAERAYRNAAGLRPDRFEPWFNLGGARLRLRDWPGAEDAFDRAVDLAPDHPEARLGRGLARLRQGDLAGAERDAAEIEALDPSIAARLRKALADFEGDRHAVQGNRPPSV